MGKSFIGQNKARLFRKRSLCAVFAAAALLPGCGGAAQHKNNHHNISSKITADLASTKNTIPANFVGFSNELKDVISTEDSGSPIFTANNTSLINLLKLLGQNGYARFGGNSQDTIPAPALTLPIAQDLGGFLAALGPGWTLNYGLDGKINNRAEAVKQAGIIENAVRNAGGGNPVNFSIGNEPDLWSGGQGAWTPIYNRYYSALKTAYPSIKIDAPELENLSDPLLRSYINGTVAGLSPLVLATTHWYPMNAGSVTVDKALSAAGSAPSWSGWPDKMRIIESNLTFDGGGAKPQYSSDKQSTTALVSATWYLEMAIEAATHKWAGVGQHMVLTAAGARLSGYDRPSYNDCVKQSGSNWSPAPCFYGWYLMSMMEGQPIVANTISGASPANVTGGAYVLTTKNKSGNANILVVNGNKDTTYNITPNQSSPWSTAKVYQLEGTSCTDKTPTLNGKPIGNGGSWAGTPETLKHGEKLTIPACGAAVVKIQGGGRVRGQNAFNATSVGKKLWRNRVNGALRAHDKKRLLQQAVLSGF